KVLVCSADNRTRAINFNTTGVGAFALNSTDDNDSYFVGLDASEIKPQTLLSGDRNFPGYPTGQKKWSATPPGPTTVLNDASVDFDVSIHKNAGNIGLGDGSAQQVNGVNLRKQLSSAMQN